MAFCPTSGIFYFGMLTYVRLVTGRLSAARIVCGGNGAPGFNRCMDTGIQRQHISGFYGKMQTVRVVEQCRRVVYSHRWGIMPAPCICNFYGHVRDITNKIIQTLQLSYLWKLNFRSRLRQMQGDLRCH